MKKIALISLLTIIILSHLGYYCAYSYEIYCAKQHAREQLLSEIPDEQLTKINIDSKVYCEDEGRELNLNGQMFDVVKKVSQNGKEYFMCIADNDESAALKKLADVIHSGSTSDSNGKDGVKIKNNVQDIFCNQFYQGNENLTASSNLIYYYDYSSRLSELSGKIFIPPPKA